MCSSHKAIWKGAVCTWNLDKVANLTVNCSGFPTRLCLRKAPRLRVCPTRRCRPKDGSLEMRQPTSRQIAS